MSTEINCFKILGLEDLKVECRLYQIAGLRRESPDYHGNIQRIRSQLTRQMRAPVTTRERNGETLLIVPAGFADPPDHIALVGAVATIRNTGETINLHFGANTSEWDAVRLGFLQFGLKGPLRSDPTLWQPSSPRPFFFKQPHRVLGPLDVFEGFAFRVMPHPEGGFGIAVDLRRKLVSREPLSAAISREAVNALKGRSCVYKMGERWFEVSVSGLSDLKINEPSFQHDGKFVSLIGYLNTMLDKPVPESIAALSPEGAAIYYRTYGPEQKSAPAELCYLVEDTHGEHGARHQQATVIEPHERSRRVNAIVRDFLHSIKIAGASLRISDRPGRTNNRPFAAPDLGFGNEKTLKFDHRLRVGEGWRDYARRRLNLLDDKSAGFFEQSTLGRQHIVVPKSIANSSGPEFIAALKAQVMSLYPNGAGYEPELIVYDDLTGPRNFVAQSRAIKAAMEAARVQPGCALVMVHRYARRARSADQLAAWTVKEFSHLFQITAAVIHTDMVRRSYAGVQQGGQTRYVVREPERKRLTGYIRNVAINKVLLTNGKWPFVLNSSLHADIVIGIDVKTNTAAFTLIGDGGRVIRLTTSPSGQKEQLLKNQVAQYVEDLIRKEYTYLKKTPKEIVIHRDGRTWPSEISGVQEACQRLAKDGFIDAGWRLTVLEIAKSAAAPVRLFHARPGHDGRPPRVENPLVGSWIAADEDEGFVCTTGRPFPIPGTANPLHVKRAHGTMPIARCLEDVFALSCLTWGRPEGVTRLPISIKLCDRSLAEEAAEYDEDEIAFGNDNYAEGKA
jgi:hypothetical protein